MEVIANLRIDLARIIPMRSAKRETVIQQQPSIGHISPAHGDREPFPKVFTKRQVKGRMARQMRRRRIAVGKARTVIDIGRSIAMPWQIHDPANMQSIELIVVQWAETIAEREVGEAAVDVA